MSDAAPLVCVIDDDSSVRQALSRLLRTAGFRTAAFGSAEEFLGQAPPEPPACLVLDVYLPGLSGLDLHNTLANRETHPPVVFVTGHGDIPMSVRAMKAGAADFLPKPFADQDLLTAVRQAVARHDQVRQAGAEAAEISRRAEALSARERQVMGLVVRGLLNKQVGHQLGVTEKTVKAHRARVMHKMQARSLAELVRMAGRMRGEPAAP
jgi:FixJ family two-component response regulator